MTNPRYNAMMAAIDIEGRPGHRDLLSVLIALHILHHTA